MSRLTEAETRFYSEAIEGRLEIPEVTAWEAARIRVRPSPPEYMAKLHTPPGELYALVGLRTRFGEGRLVLPIGLYDVRGVHRVDKWLVDHNRQVLRYSGQSSRWVTEQLGLNSGDGIAGMSVNTSGGSDIFFTPGWNIHIERRFPLFPENETSHPLIQIPDGHESLEALAAYGFVQAVQAVFPHLRVEVFSNRQFLQGIEI